MSPFYLSLEVASLALVHIIVIGLILVYAVRRLHRRAQAICDALFTLPLVLPPVVVGFALLMIFSPGNTWGAWLQSHGMAVVFTKVGAVLAATVIGFPLFYQTVRSALHSIDTRLEDVARTLGASEFRIFCTISLPLAWQGILSGSILAFCRALGEFGATILIAGNIPGVTQTMPLAIYADVEAGTYMAAWQLVIYICALTLSLLWVVHHLSQGKLAREEGRQR